MKNKLELFVNSVRTVPIDGFSVTPTAIRYHGNNHVIGHDAAEGDDAQGLLIDDFKISLGAGDYNHLASKTRSISSERKRSVVGIAQDFIVSTLRSVENWSHHHALAPAKHIIVAEPLALEDTSVPGDSWLSNYRANIRRILHNFDNVDFLPEPFAVFQYYRYGIRHPLISERRKHVALVLDFGGGTFDVSVVETTAQGDISQSGRNQRPLAAKSVAAAGYFINRKIAEYILFKSSPEHKSNRATRRAIELFNSGQWNESDPTINPEIHIFLRNFSRLVQRCEKAKVAICSSVLNWDMNANLGAKAPVRIKVPSRPFSMDSAYAEISFDAGELREIFEKEIWGKKLKTAILDVLRRASSELEGNPISVVLLSGGSSNIGWLRKLIEKDLSVELKQSEIVELAENFQEIVSKGLAVECARRYYTAGEGDFESVLYNKLCLLLSPNEKGIELRKFRPLFPSALIDTGEDAILLPSAQSLRGWFDQELRWKVKLSSMPSRQLEYHFMRSSFDPEDIEGRLNVVQSVLHTPKSAIFGQSIDVSLLVREDGTATPSFTYGKGHIGREVTVHGTPFYLDMTAAVGGAEVDSYIGFDFGSCTSSFSTVSRADVNVYRERSQDPTWMELSDLVFALPYPVATQLARYIGEVNSESLFKRGRAALEAALCFLAYTAYIMSRSEVGRRNTAIFKNLAHRSARPLWTLFKDSLARMPASQRSTYAAARLLEPPHLDAIEIAVSEVAKEKHDKAAAVDFNKLLKPLCNIIAQTLEGKSFGYFEEVHQEAFSTLYGGVFRSLRGANEPFLELFSYTGPCSFSKNQILLVDRMSGEAIDMTPIYVWGLNLLSGDRGPADLYMFDSVRADGFIFNAAQERQEISVERQGSLGALWEMIASIREQDTPLEILTSIKLSERT